LIDASIGNLPRLVTSRSIDKKSGDSRIARKQSVKLAVVERAMHNIGRDAAPAFKDDVSKLDKFLNVDD
jgi:lipopolysaccharide biosynthesis protein